MRFNANKIMLFLLSVFLIASCNSNMSSSSQYNSSDDNYSNAVQKPYVSDIVDGGQIFDNELFDYLFQVYSYDERYSGYPLSSSISYYDFFELYGVWKNGSKIIESNKVDNYYIAGYISDSMKKTLEEYEYDEKFIDFYKFPGFNDILTPYRLLYKKNKVSSEEIKFYTFKTNLIPEIYNNDNLIFIFQNIKFQTSVNDFFLNITDYLYSQLLYEDGYYKISDFIDFDEDKFIFEYDNGEKYYYRWKFNYLHDYISVVSDDERESIVIGGHELTITNHEYYADIKNAIYKIEIVNKDTGYKKYYLDYQKIKKQLSI